MENIPFFGGGEGVGGDLQCDCLNSKMPFYVVSLSLCFLTPSGRGLYNGHGSIGRGGGEVVCHRRLLRPNGKPF